jgi:hypothetical protein
MGIEYKQRAEAQYACIRRFMAATGYGPMEWSQLGHAEAFEKAWNDRVRDVDTLYTLSLSVKNKVNKILE